MSGSISVSTPRAPARAVCAAGGGVGTGCAMVSGRTNALVPVPRSHGQETSITTMAHEWPLRSFLELGAYPGAVPCARLHTRAVLWEWGMAGLGERAELVVSELTTNAVQAPRVPGPPDVIRLWLLSDKEKVLILVWDASPHPLAPSYHDASDIREGGRGLMLVDAISDQWSWYSVPGGKVVWAVCSDGKEEHDG